MKLNLLKNEEEIKMELYYDYDVVFGGIEELMDEWKNEWLCDVCDDGEYFEVYVVLMMEYKRMREMWFEEGKDGKRVLNEWCRFMRDNEWVIE